MKKAPCNGETRGETSSKNIQKIKDNSIVVYNLNPATTKTSLETHFWDYGEIVHIELINIQSSGQRAACMYFEKPVKMGPTLVVDLKVVAVVSQKSIIPGPTRSIFLKTFAPSPAVNISPYPLSDYFQRYGRIEHIRQVPIKKQRNDGYRHVFLKFSDYQAAEKAIADSPHIVNGLIMVALTGKNLF